MKNCFVIMIALVAVSMGQAKAQIVDPFAFIDAFNPDTVLSSYIDTPTPDEDESIVPMQFKASNNAGYSVYRKGRGGIIIVDQGARTRAFQPFGSNVERGRIYANMVKAYADSLGPKVKVYNMLIPEQVAYYCPPEAQQWTSSPQAAIRKIYASLPKNVTSIDVDSSLRNHVEEDIYLRTDHHWAPLGAFYAARKFAQVAGVPFRNLDSYDCHVVHNFVGTMYQFSGATAVKNAPEDFYYWTPKGVSHTATFTRYSLGKGREVTGEMEPIQQNFFLKYPDGSAGAYCTFMGGDDRTVVVKTNVGNGRRLCIMKDSFGNALPGYLFYSFEEIHVVDYRYFYHNILQYLRKNGITDLLIAGCSSFAFSPSTINKYENLLHTNK